jgi:hypothetical protein
VTQFAGEEFERLAHSYEPRYDLDDSEMQELSRTLLEERDPGAADKVVCYRLERGSAYENVARSVEREVFEKYFGNTSEQMLEEYGPYEDQSVFFLSIDQELGQPAGVLRVIENGPAGLKTLNDLENAPAEVPRISALDVQSYHDIESFDDCWDVGTVAVRKPYRSDTLTSVQLYRALYVSALDQNIEHFVSIIDHKPYVKMTDYLGIPFVPMLNSEPFPYLGSPASHAVYGDVSEFYPKMNRKRYTVRGALARSALRPLVKGTSDHSLQL